MKSKTGNENARAARKTVRIEPGSLACSRTIRMAVDHLRQADPVLRKLIDRIGPFRLTLKRRRFSLLARAIISQQISTTAADSISKRLRQASGPGGLTARRLAGLSVEEFRQAGVSPQKRGYLLDLSRKTLSGQLRLHGLSRLSDEDVVKELVQVKGIGLWTAQMFLIFSLGRLDVFPHDDLGIRAALRNLYGLKELPDKLASQKIAASWRPYASLASWYCWRSLEAKS